MARDYDLIVIGSGTSGTTAAYKCRGAGGKVAVIDQLPFGGTCALRGCDPKTVLIGAARVVDEARGLSGRGVSCDNLKIDWPSLQKFKRTFTTDTPAEVEKGLNKKGIDTFHGHARFKGPNSIEIGSETLNGRFILLATGSVPMKLGIEGEELLTTSDQFLELETLPDRILLIGGGYIGFEVAHLCRRAGSNVTMLEQSSRLLGPFDRDLVEMLVKKSRSVGIDIRTNTTVKAIKQADKALVVHAVTEAGEQDFKIDMVVHSAGRKPMLDSLDLDAGGVAHEKGRLKLNRYLQSVSNASVYAAGDAAAMGPALTPVATYDGQTAAANMLESNHITPDYSVLAGAVFSIPPLASVGLTEEKARETGITFESNFQDTSGWYTSRRVNEDVSGFKIMTELNTGKIVGAHLIGPDADQVINLFAIAMRAGMLAKTLKEMLLTYPTPGYDITYML